MTEPDRLPPDQRAVLSLVLDRGKSYAEVAAMLAIPEAVVRDRAHAALDALAEGSAADGSQRTQAGAGDTAATSGTTSGERSRLTSGAPAAASGAANGERTRPTPDAIGTARALPGGARQARPAPSSRLGGAVLLVALIVAIVVGVVLLTGGGKGGGNGSAASANATSGAGSNTGTATTGSSGNRARIDKKLTLSPVEGESHAGGEAYVLSDGSRRAFYVAAHGLEPSHGFFYAVWLYNSPSSSAPLGRAPAVGSNGRLEGGGPLPTNAADYARLIVTRETSTHARHPGTIVLSGPFSLH
jgi:hypothetical protein